MSESIEAFQNSLVKGYIDAKAYAQLDSLPELLTNDTNKRIKVLTTIDHELRSCDEFWFSVAFLTSGGLAALKQTLFDLKDRGITGKILTSKYLNFTQPEALRSLLHQFPNIQLRIAEFGDFHAKGYLFRQGKSYNMIIGSSNLTSSALATNKEWNLKITAQKDSYIMRNALDEFRTEFSKATKVTDAWISEYETVYVKATQRRKSDYTEQVESPVVKPNLMQREALANLVKLRVSGATKALLISATGTGKTYLSAFDVKAFKSMKCLFVVHRLNIAKAAMNTFEKVHGSKRTYGLYSGAKRELDADFLFTTVQTISRDEHLSEFDSNYFDYIVIDETHRAGARTYSKILDHFNPKFLLGMTATPERTDLFDIFSLFDHNIAYEIRLHRAMEEKMLTEFHYYGVQDISVNGEAIKDKSDFRYLEADERVKHIIDTSRKYGTDDGSIRGLVFCSKNEECTALSKAFNNYGYETIALTKDNSEKSRQAAIDSLESDSEKRLEYIFTVDIFNEGIDIPRVNQIIMLRPTNSAIVFVQQLGRGLRKVEGKEYLTIIDFIGNYQNNYLVPIALYGDTSYNKDTIRKLMSEGSRMIPGSSTINFDQVTKGRIYKSIDSSNMQLKRDLVKDYKLLKYKLGDLPMMQDFVEHGSRDPYQYVSYSKSSYYEFVAREEKTLYGQITGDELLLLKYFSKEINNGKRVEESLILSHLLEDGSSSFSKLNDDLSSRFGYTTNRETFDSALNNLALLYARENHKKKLTQVAKIHGFEVLNISRDVIEPGPSLSKAFKNPTFRKYLQDDTDYGIHKFSDGFKNEDFVDGFVRYRKYSRKDCFRILNWKEQPLMQNVGGYMYHPEGLNCPIFVNYHKEDDITDTTKYDDKFLDRSTIQYMSKNKRRLTSPDVQKFWNAKSKKTRLPLLVKKDNDEGDEFYYIADLTPIQPGFEQATIGANQVPVVKMEFKLDKAVSVDVFKYLTKSSF